MNVQLSKRVKYKRFTLNYGTFPNLNSLKIKRNKQTNNKQVRLLHSCMFLKSNTGVCSLFSKLHIKSTRAVKHKQFSFIITEKRKTELTWFYFLLADFRVSWVRFLVQIDSRLLLKDMPNISFSPFLVNKVEVQVDGFYVIFLEFKFSTVILKWIEREYKALRHGWRQNHQYNSYNDIWLRNSSCRIFSKIFLSPSIYPRHSEGPVTVSGRKNMTSICVLQHFFKDQAFLDTAGLFVPVLLPDLFSDTNCCA